MGRPSVREARRREIIDAFASVLADHGYAGATIAAVAGEAGIAPGLVHHHFKNKEDLLESLFDEMIVRFRRRIASMEANGQRDQLLAYTDAALALDATADVTAARCWVGLFSEAVRSPSLFRRMRRRLDTELAAIERRSGNTLSSEEAGAILAFIIGSLVMGAFAPRETGGFAAPALRRLLRALESTQTP